MVIMEEFAKPAVNTLEEVKKLQDLVRKLEIQNQQLRNKQNKMTKKSTSCSKDVKSQLNVMNVSSAEKDANTIIVMNNNYPLAEVPHISSAETEKENLTYFDELDIIKVSDMDMSDEDSWLYTSSKELTSEQKSESPYKWLRKDVDDPDNIELQLAKRALITKLNEIEILSPTSQRNQKQHSSNQNITGLRKVHVPYKVSTQEHAQRSVLDTRTFTKSKKKQALEFLASPVVAELCNEAGKVECEHFRRGSDVSLDSSTGTYTLTDASDVQEVARMQEESLRLSSPVGTPKQQSVTSNLSSRRLFVSSKSSVSDADNTEQLSLNSHVYDGSCSEAISTTVCIPLEQLNHSDHSSPSESPYGSNISLNNVGSDKGNTYRRSLPNLNRRSCGTQKTSCNTPLNVKKQHQNFASKTSASGRRSDSNLLATSKLRRETALSPVRNKLKQPSNYVTPTCSTSSAQVYPSKDVSTPSLSRNMNVGTRPPAKTGLPRPSRATSATRVWSGIPVPSMVNKKHTVEDSWSDGCF